MTKQFMTVDQVAELLSVSAETLRRFETARRIPLSSRPLGGGHRGWYSTDVKVIAETIDPGNELLAPPSMIRRLEELRQEVNQRLDGILDLLTDDQDASDE